MMSHESLSNTKRALSQTAVRRTSTTFALGACIVLSAACDRSVTAPTPPAASSLVASIVTNVYLPTYDSIASRGAALSASLQTLSTTPTTPNLLAARAAWRAARVQYERNEGFAFGPLITQEIDPSIDSWPIDREGIDALINGSDPISKASLDVLDGTVKGFHGIEYILFGDGGARTAASLTARERTYLTAAGQSLAAKTQELADAWSPAGGNYAGAITSPGTAGSVYVSQGAALQEVVNGLVGPTEEVANSKIADPLQNGTAYEESAFSDNTLADLQNDLHGAYAVYVGGYGSSAPASGGGVSAIIAGQDPALDQLVRTQFADAFAALDAVQPSFDQALQSNPALLRTAQQAILTLNHTLMQRVIPLVGGIEDAD